MLTLPTLAGSFLLVAACAQAFQLSKLPAVDTPLGIVTLFLMILDTLIALQFLKLIPPVFQFTNILLMLGFTLASAYLFWQRRANT